MSPVPHGFLTAEAGAVLAGRGPVRLALTAARLQAVADARGVAEVLVWGNGRVGALRFEPPLPADADVRVTPNRLTWTWGAGRLAVAALPTTPAIVLEGQGALPTLRLVAPRDVPPGFAARARSRPLDDGWCASSERGTLLVRGHGVEVDAGGRVRWGTAARVVLAAGADDDEARRSAEAVLAAGAAAVRELDVYERELVDTLEMPDPVLRSLFVHGLHAARSARKTLADGRFAGFAAGIGYALPPRTYYRDAYWTLQALLPLWPELAHEQLLLLSREIGLDGRAPSGVVVAAEVGERVWRARRAADPALAADHPRAGVWWADHTDAPLFYVLLACEVAAWRGDRGLFATRVDGRTIGERVAAALAHAHATTDASGLPVKPEHDRDWADNVFRGGYVTYDVALYHGALVRTADLVAAHDPARAGAYRARARDLRTAARRELWRDDLGHFVEFRGLDGRAEDHLAIDTLTALRYGLADEAQATRVLAAARARLETRHNDRQPWGDWGVMSVDPPYAAWVRRRGKSRFPYRYHNGADWPVWDGVYAEERLRRGLPGWRYALTRAWTHGLAHGRATPVEYVSPPYGVGSLSNGWSAMPTAAMLTGGFGLTAAGGVQAPPWGASVLRRRGRDGREERIAVTDRGLEVEHDG